MQAATPSSACLDLVKRFEGFVAEPQALGDGRWLVGYGHVRMGAPTQPIGETEAVFLLKEDLEEISQVLRRAATAHGFNQNQFDALASFGFSVGAEALENSEVLRLASEGHWAEAGVAMEAWRVSSVSGRATEALVSRRASEKALLLTGDDFQPSPSAVLRPVRDAAETADYVAPLAPQKAEQSDTLGLAALGVLGLLLIAMGVTGADDDNGISYFIFAAPGLVGVAMSVYYLLKKTVETA